MNRYSLVLKAILCVLFFSTVQAADVQPVLNAIDDLRETVNSNSGQYSRSDLNRILTHIENAQRVASEGRDSSSYLDCRNAGYSHDNCSGQGRDYLPCRQRGYNHESCSGQTEGYLDCRSAGYSHDNCSGQQESYLPCRQAGYSHDSCNGQGPGYLRCRQAGYSHDSCNGQGAKQMGVVDLR